MSPTHLNPSLHCSYYHVLLCRGHHSIHGKSWFLLFPPHAFFFWSMSYVLHWSLVYLYTINYIFMLFLRVFQSFCLINKCTVTSPVETFPSLTFTGYFKSDLSFGSVLRWIVPSLFSVLLCSPFPCPIGSECLPPSLGLFHLISSSRCALSWITTVISSC